MSEKSDKAKKAKEIEDRYQAVSMYDWIKENRPQLEKKLAPAWAKLQMSRTWSTESPEDLAKRAKAEMPQLSEQAMAEVVRAAGGDTQTAQVNSEYTKYKTTQSQDMAQAVEDATARKQVDPEHEFTAPDQAAFNNHSQKIAENNRQKAQAGSPEGTTTDGKSTAGAFDTNTGGTSQSHMFDYQGISDYINFGAQMSEIMKPEQLRSPGFRISVTGAGMDAVRASATSGARTDADGNVIYGGPADPTAAGRLGQASSGRPRPTMENRGLEQGMGARSGQAPTKNVSRSYSESMAYLNSLTPDQVTRVQQHMAMAGLFTPTELRGKQIIWGYGMDEKTVRAWAQLHQESLGAKKSIADVMRDRELAYAPTMASVLAGTDGSGGGPGGGDTVTMTLSDPDTVKSAADNAFVQILGRLPNDNERNILVKSIRDAEQAQGQSKLAQINGINRRNQQKLNAAAGIGGQALTADEIAAAGGELDVLLGGAPSQGGSIIFPVGGKASYGNDWGQGRSGGRHHQGTDIFAAQGTPVLAAVAGTVRYVGTGGVQGKMRSVSIRGVDGKNYFYNHLDDNVAVSAGQAVKAGQTIAAVGDAVHRIGTGNHLHFSINEGSDRAENPYPYLQTGQRASGVALPVGPKAGAGSPQGALEPIPASLVQTEDVDVGASVEQWAKEQRPDEYGAQKLGTAYSTLRDMLTGKGV